MLGSHIVASVFAQKSRVVCWFTPDTMLYFCPDYSFGSRKGKWAI